jgi:NADPH:quinone reductase-like Zn-dependent oxidoreductase
VKAIRLYEGPEVRVEDAPEPEVGPGRVRVAVQATVEALDDLARRRNDPVRLALLPGAWS